MVSNNGNTIKKIQISMNNTNENRRNKEGKIRQVLNEYRISPVFNKSYGVVPSTSTDENIIVLYAYDGDQMIGILYATSSVHHNPGTFNIKILRGEENMKKTLIERLKTEIDKNIEIFTVRNVNVLKGMSFSETTNKQYVLYRKGERVYKRPNTRISIPSRGIYTDKLMKLLAFLNYHKSKNGYIIKPVMTGLNFTLKLEKTKNKNRNNKNSITTINSNGLKTIPDESRMYNPNSNQADARNICVYVMNVINGQGGNQGLKERFSLGVSKPDKKGSNLLNNNMKYVAYITKTHFQTNESKFPRNLSNINSLITVSEDLTASAKFELKTMGWMHVPIFIKMCEKLVSRAQNKNTSA